MSDHSAKAEQLLKEALVQGAAIQIANAEMMTMSAVCAFFGGDDKPINPSTLYRGIKVGRYPAPVKLSRSISRWRRSECVAYRDKLPAKAPADGTVEGA